MKTIEEHKASYNFAKIKKDLEFDLKYYEDQRDKAEAKIWQTRVCLEQIEQMKTMTGEDDV